jgi:hypothetical protein
VLTKPEDRIPAMTGMIRYFQRLTGNKPIPGLWEESFISDLNWDFAERRKNAPLMGPSWSWLSYSGQTTSLGRGYWYSREHGSEKIEPRLESFDIHGPEAHLLLDRILQPFTSAGWSGPSRSPVLVGRRWLSGCPPRPLLEVS